MFSANLCYMNSNIWGAWSAFIMNNPRHYVLQGKPKPNTKCFIHNSCSNWSILWNWGTIQGKCLCRHFMSLVLYVTGECRLGDLSNSTQHCMALWLSVEDSFLSIPSGIGVLHWTVSLEPVPIPLLSTPFPPKCQFQLHTGGHLGWNCLITVGGNLRKYD